jgi:hypothetical protein
MLPARAVPGSSHTSFSDDPRLVQNLPVSPRRDVVYFFAPARTTFSIAARIQRWFASGYLHSSGSLELPTENDSPVTLVIAAPRARSLDFQSERSQWVSSTVAAQKIHLIDSAH